MLYLLINFQSERPFTNFFEFCTNPSYMPDLQEESNCAGQTSPLCAAITTGHRVHYGNILRELAVNFMTLSEAQVLQCTYQVHNFHDLNTYLFKENLQFIN